jgi:hypothetical protein
VQELGVGPLADLVVVADPVQHRAAEHHRSRGGRGQDPTGPGDTQVLIEQERLAVRQLQPRPLQERGDRAREPVGRGPVVRVQARQEIPRRGIERGVAGRERAAVLRSADDTDALVEGGGLVQDRVVRIARGVVDDEHLQVRPRTVQERADRGEQGRARPVGGHDHRDPRPRFALGARRGAEPVEPRQVRRRGGEPQIRSAAQGPEAFDPGGLVATVHRVREIGEEPAAFERRQVLPVAAQQPPGPRDLAEDIRELDVDGGVPAGQAARPAEIQREVEERQRVPAVLLSAELEADDPRERPQRRRVHLRATRVAAPGRIEQARQVERPRGRAGEQMPGARRTGPQRRRGQRPRRPLPRPDQ